MSQPSFEDLEDFLQNLILPFYEIERDLSLPIQNHRNENDAEHSWGLAVMALSLAPQIDPDLDIGKVTIYAVIHDLVEIFAGDTSVWAEQKHLDSKQSREKEAMKLLATRFSKFPYLIKSIQDYNKKDNSEAKFVYALDKFLALLTLYKDKGYYYLRGRITKQRFDKQFVLHRKKAHSHPDIAYYYEQLVKSFDNHPEYFYQEK
ncbi:MAG TPA: HD domain-containing protein [Candidatus Saccharimonadales bacterium]|nr:HD domain-containing protein [Candidatus Saccharimonadales bacterium]